jgi:hypothetical protein
MNRMKGLLLGSVLTTHPARLPMKCIGTAGHPLPSGEGCPSEMGNPINTQLASSDQLTANYRLATDY